MADDTAYCARLCGETDLDGWRAHARGALAAGIAPERINWEVTGRSATLNLIPRADIPGSRASKPLRLNRQHLALLMTALLHCNPDRFALGYRLLWRMQETPRLMGNPADQDVRRIAAMAKNVRRDIHKMHAFIRFRKVGERNDDNGVAREQFAAWFEPDHHITAHVARFFRNRFTGMDWLIVTPRASIAWDGARLQLGPGGHKSDMPDRDTVEDEWRSYYKSIFNPARVKVQAMKSEMPVKYWKNLPEAELIAGLIDGSAAKVRQMQPFAAKPAQALSFFEKDGHAAGFANLDSLNHAMITRNDWPYQGFAERFILGEGPGDADIMLIGEQPGDAEDRKGEVFAGPAGRLLNIMLAEAGIDRAKCYLTNAVKRFKYKPRGERRIHRTPSASDVSAYRDWLLYERYLVRPKMTIALGAAAAKSLTGQTMKIAASRGHHSNWDDIGDLVITVHPSFLLRLNDSNGRTIEQQRCIREYRYALG